jgi:hypothetical protein
MDLPHYRKIQSLHGFIYTFNRRITEYLTDKKVSMNRINDNEIISVGHGRNTSSFFDDF